MLMPNHSLMRLRLLFVTVPILLALLLSSCAGAATQQAFQATLPNAAQTAPIYTATPTSTPSLTPTITPSPTPTATLTPTAPPTLPPSATPTITPTAPLWTPTPASPVGAPPAFANQSADLAPTAGWSCGDFPCEDDIAGFLRRIRVPVGYQLEHVGRLPGQPLQIAYGPDGRLYATVLEGGTRTGAVYALNADGSSERYSSDLVSPLGLAFQPGTDTLYVSARVTVGQGGGLWRIPAGGGAGELVVSDLPCCFSLIDNQPNGITFGPDGYLYLGVGSLTDHAESPTPRSKPFADVLPNEAAVLRIQPHTGAVEVYASGIRNPYDLAFGVDGQLYVSDNGTLAGPGDRLLRVERGAHYGWPFWRARGCSQCPPTQASLTIAPDWLSLPDFTLPRGLTVYTAAQFPANIFGSVFVAFWNGTANAQRIVRIDPRDPSIGTAGYVPEAFVTGLIRPTDVTVAPDGTLVVADFIYGHIWRVRYVG